MAPGLGPQCIQALFKFIGYGPTNPRFVFIGPEEASDGHLVNLQTRCNVFPPDRHDRVQACHDLAAGYNAQGFQAEAQRYVVALTPGAERTWTFAAQVVAALRSPSTDWQEEYLRLGALDGDTLLTELFPLPKPRTGNWPAPYVGVFGHQNQNAYYDTVWPRDVIPGSGVSPRADLLATTLASISMSRSTYVFGYGRGGRQTEFWDRFDRLFAVNGNWTTVIAGVAEIARHSLGAVVARLAHPSGDGITAAAIPQLLASIQSLP